ncbi:MAG: hypothetical protein ACE5FP_05035 [Gemmatimonadota bacterium]
MEIRPARMIYLGYGKYWRSDEIAGLLPIENGRGPGRRTEVYVTTREEPIVASRSQQTILGDMASLPAGVAHASEQASALGSMLEELDALPPVLRRLLEREGGFDVEFWVRRLSKLQQTGEQDDGEQEDLFREG